MSPRVAPVLAFAVVSFAVAGCTGAASAAPSAPPTPSSSIPTAPVPTRVPTSSPDTGDVTVGTGPELSVEPRGTGAIAATIADPAAKAWRIVVTGIGDQGGDQWVLEVETGDVSPMITTTETVAGVTGEPVDRSSLADGTGPARVCSTVLPACVEAAGFRLPDNGDGMLSARLVVTDPAASLAVTGATATWPGEPFVLGPWTTTEAFPWGS